MPGSKQLQTLSSRYEPSTSGYMNQHVLPFLFIWHSSLLDTPCRQQRKKRISKHRLEMSQLTYRHTMPTAHKKE